MAEESRQEEPRQEEQSVRQDNNLPHKAWVSLSAALGKPFAVVLAIIAVGFVILLVVGLIWYLIPIFDSKKGLTITQRKDLVQGFASVVQALAVLVAGVVGLGGLYFTWKNLNQTRQLTEQGQITERFTRAIDQLGETDDDGNPRLEIRLGGIYALERIDKESPERAYHPTVMEVLTAYVRENAPWPTKASNKSPERRFIKPPEGDPVSTSGPDEAAEQDEDTKQGVEPTSAPPRTDIQAILRVLNRREEDRVPENHRVQSLDLRGTNLQEAWLWDANLSGAMLEGAVLQEAVLAHANLIRADLRSADLRGAQLAHANLQGAYLWDANLQGANLGAARLLEAELQGADLSRALLLEADLSGAKLSVSIYQPPNLQRANLQGAYLREANLSKANLSEANLSEADLSEADLSEANLSGAVLQGARLLGADLSETRELSQKQIEWTIGINEPLKPLSSNATKLPEGLNRPKLWSKDFDEQIEIIREREFPPIRRNLIDPGQ
jgi:uncharacterized protein YjbI with pentapeptide repeats